MLEMRTVSDKWTGRTIRAIGCPGSDTGQHYFTANTWLSDSRRLVVSAGIDERKRCRYVLFDMDSGRSQSIVDDGGWGAGIVSSDDKLYYIDGRALRCVDLTTMSPSTVSLLEEGCEFHGPPSITNDGSVIGIYWSRDGEWVIGSVEVSAGAVRPAIAPGFAKPYDVANHAMINPIYRNLLFYAHEGKTEHIPDRIWTVDISTGEAKNLYRQKRSEDGTHVEYVGHEMWAYGGERLFFVKYDPSPLKPAGIYWVDKHGEHSGFLNGDYSYWHAAASPDDRWVVADTHEHGSKIVLVDAARGTSRPLCEVRRWEEHPGHPHPAFSPDSRKVSFTFADDDNRLWVGIVEI